MRLRVYAGGMVAEIFGEGDGGEVMEGWVGVCEGGGGLGEVEAADWGEEETVEEMEEGEVTIGIEGAEAGREGSGVEEGVAAVAQMCGSSGAYGQH